MKRTLVFMLAATAISANAGLLDKDENGNFAAMADLSEKADAAKVSASNEWAKASAISKETYAKAIEETKKAMAMLNVKAEDVQANLGLSAADLKAQLENFKAEKLLAYAGEYQKLLETTKTKVADYGAQVKELKWTQKFTAKGRALKGQLKDYQAQLDTLSSQYGVYIDKLKAMGINLSDYGLEKDAE
ncbi:hypothetical protein [Pontiella sp.]|uniref:hypothetical protein n=1 Tax=Pontiella sp. TaxID=2837462 RepID=UPI0035678FC5